MTAWRQAIELAIGEKGLAALGAIARSGTEPASRVERARMLLAYRKDASFFAVAQGIGCTIKPFSVGLSGRWLMVQLRRSMIEARRPTITAEAKAWVVNLACRKAKELGYPHELWTALLACATYSMGRK